MKITLSENESYNIELPQEITLQELSGVVERLNNILKINKNSLLTTPTRYYPVNKSSKTTRVNGEKPERVETMKTVIKLYEELKGNMPKETICREIEGVLASAGWKKMVRPAYLSQTIWEFKKRLENNGN